MNIAIERDCTAEHARHVSDIGGIPSVQITIERRRVIEHVGHVGNA